MAISNKYTVSILYPNVECEYKTMTSTTSHDLGLDNEGSYAGSEGTAAVYAHP